jgi:dCMP deaminase
MYVTLFPCSECAKIIIQSGIRKVYYLDDKYKSTDSVIASKRMFDASGVNYEQFVPDKEKIEITLKCV